MSHVIFCPFPSVYIPFFLFDALPFARRLLTAPTNSFILDRFTEDPGLDRKRTSPLAASVNASRPLSPKKWTPPRFCQVRRGVPPWLGSGSLAPRPAPPGPLTHCSTRHSRPRPAQVPPMKSRRLWSSAGSLTMRGTLCWPPSRSRAFIQAAKRPGATACTRGASSPKPPARCAA